MNRQPTVIDLFCGAGGMSEGFRQAGFNVLVGQDIDATAGKTFEGCHPGSRFISGPIQQVSAEDLLAAAGLGCGDLDVLVGGPPCQGYSYYNHQRGSHDPRAGLFREYLRIVDALRPHWLVMENVAGITSIAEGGIVREINAGMTSLGYRVEHRLLLAEQYGVPQERRRMFFVATRDGSPIAFPTASFGAGGDKLVTVWDAISDLPILKNGERNAKAGYRTKPRNAFQVEMREAAELDLANHSAPKLAAINLARMKHIPPGGSWRDIPFDLLPEGMKRAKRSDHTKRYGRPRKTDLSCTILTKCDVHWGAYIHPTQDRAISVREAARLQSFPDRVVFSGSLTEQYVQVGNAVPPRLARAVAETIINLRKSAAPTRRRSKAKQQYALAL